MKLGLRIGTIAARWLLRHSRLNPTLMAQSPANRLPQPIGRAVASVFAGKVD